MKKRRKSPRKSRWYAKSEWAIGLFVAGAVVSLAAIAHVPVAVSEPTFGLADCLTIGWAFGACILVARIASFLESKWRARFATQPIPQSVSQDRPRKRAPVRAAVEPPVFTPLHEPTFDEASAFASPPRRRRPPRRKIHTSDEAWLAHLRRSAETVRIQVDEPRETKAHGIHAPLYDDPIDHVGTGRVAYVDGVAF